MIAEEYYIKQFEAIREREAAAYAVLTGGATTIRFINTNPTPQETWKHFWKKFFELRDKHRT